MQIELKSLSTIVKKLCFLVFQKYRFLIWLWWPLGWSEISLCWAGPLLATPLLHQCAWRCIKMLPLLARVPHSVQTVTPTTLNNLVMKSLGFISYRLQYQSRKKQYSSRKTNFYISNLSVTRGFYIQHGLLKVWRSSSSVLFEFVLSGKVQHTFVICRRPKHKPFLCVPSISFCSLKCPGRLQVGGEWWLGALRGVGGEVGGG